MSDTNLYIGNLPWGATEDMLKDHFEQYGAIKGVRIITDRETGKSRGFGFVDFIDAASAEKAMVEDGCDFEGRTLRVSAANQQHRSGGSQQNHKPRSGGRPRREHEEQ